MDAPVTKRLIISGLTPSITADDISRRLTSFGTVKAADGFGLPNGVGETRKFGYVTLETTTGKLAKCMNLLSGSTWKGAKLRFGEAKPDFKERIALENASDEPPKKKRKRFGGVHAEDMTLVSSENAARPGWKVSELGRITRPIKMRPAHPLPEIQEPKVPKAKKTTTVDGEKKKKKRLKDPDSRARRRAIDMTKWGSTHLKGVFLELEVPVGTKKNEPEPPLPGDVSDSDSSSDNEEAADPMPPPAEAFSGLSISRPTLNSPPPPAASSTPASAQNRVSEPTQPPSNSSFSQSAPHLDANTDIQREKAQTLSLLSTLFGGDDVDDWVGEESVGSDIDVDELTKGDVILVEEDAGFEVVPRNVPAKDPSQHYKETSENEGEGEVELAEDINAEAPMEYTTAKDSTSKSTQRSTLKDLFAPREEEAGFSLLGHLDVDIELDDDLPFSIEAPTQQTHETHQDHLVSLTPPTTSVISHPSQGPLVLNPKQALFFPISSQDGIAPSRARQRDVYDVIKDNGWNWRDPAVGFFRTGTEEDIRKRWEESKGELTRDWKRRCREAGKVNRRKRGGVDNDNEY